MTACATITQAAIERAIRAAKAAGREVGTCEVTADGTVRIIAATKSGEGSKDAFEEWQGEDGDRAA